MIINPPDTKKRILLINEFSQLFTGFSTYWWYVLPLLNATGKYEIAEMCSYINNRHPLIDKCDWKVYPIEPDPDDKEALQRHSSDRFNQFGKLKLPEVLLDFKPDVVVSIRDFWMDEYIIQSPYYPLFQFIHMPTVDGEPQKQEWIEKYKTVDRMLTYSLYGKNQLERYSGGRIKVFDVASPGSDTTVFKPMDKADLRQQMGLDPDAYIIGTVMRNQPRKLFPEIFRAFARFLEICRENNRADVAAKTYLHLHTSSPDMGWDLPFEIRRHNLSHKVMITYLCEHCHAVYPSFWMGDIASCKACGQVAARTPNTSSGVDRTVLAKIQASWDLYIQYSCSEGYGMCINDSKACGVPAMVVEHSAMLEQGYNGGGIPIPVQKHYQEPCTQTNQLRALPDNEYTAHKLYELFSEDGLKELRRLGVEARETIEKYYTWEKVAKTWENAIDTMECPPQSQTWFAPPKVVKPDTQIPDGLSNELFVEWCYRNILRRPQDFYSEMAVKAIAALNLGYEVVQNQEGLQQRNPVDRNVILNFMMNQINELNKWEQHRYVVCNNLQQTRPQGQIALLEC